MNSSAFIKLHPPMNMFEPNPYYSGGGILMQVYYSLCQTLVIFMSAAVVPVQPLNIKYHIQRYNSLDFTITLQWGYPSWLPVDSFSISINNSGRARDSIRTLIVPGSQGEVNISVTYNIMHSISIVASNCAGNSDQSAALNIFKSEPQHTLCEHQ